MTQSYCSLIHNELGLKSVILKLCLAVTFVVVISLEFRKASIKIVLTSGLQLIQPLSLTVTFTVHGSILVL